MQQKFKITKSENLKIPTFYMSTTSYHLINLQTLLTPQNLNHSLLTPPNWKVVYNQF
jgi:hypothetical protein